MGSNKHLHQDLLNLHSTMDGSLLLSPRPTRARTKPNLSVSELQYKEALHALLVADPPMVDLKTKLGPVLAKHQKQVTPGHLCSLEKLWCPLISSGCKQLVLQSQKIRSALHTLVSENNFLIPDGTKSILAPVIIDDVKAHIMDCAAIMRALKNDGMQGVSKATSDLASALKHKMVGLHCQILGPIIALMEHSDVVMHEGMPCPLSPSFPSLSLLDLSSIPQLPPSKFSALGVCTPTTSKLGKQITPEKLLQSTGCDITMGEGKGTRSIEHDDVQSANDGGDVSNVDADCKLDPDIAVDECGFPTIFGSILMSQVAVDEDGWPTIFGSILNGDGEFEGVNVDSMECDQGLPSIQRINPNVRSRKLEVIAAAKAKLEKDVANGVAPPIKKRLKTKQPAQKKCLKAKMIQQWHPSLKPEKKALKAKKKGLKAKKKGLRPHAADASKGQHTKRVSKRGKPTEPKAKEDDPKADSDAQALQVGTACRKGIKNADALILSAFGSCNAATGRFDIQGKCILPDGSCKTIGILCFYEKDSFGVQVWQTLMDKINDAKGKHTKGEIMMLRDKLIADCKAGHPCTVGDAD